MKIIRTNKGEEIFVDDEWYEELNKHTWCLNNSGYAWRTTKKNEKELCKRHHILMHRQIMNVLNSNIMIDHQDTNKLNNQKSNLRVANKSTNSMNRGLQRNSTTGYKGVSFNKEKQKYEAYITANDKRVKLGYFRTAEEGALAYNEKAKELHGEFALLNEVKI
jgi:hypothetical protein